MLTLLAARLHAFWAETDDSDEDAAGDLTLAPRVIHDRLLAFATAEAELASRAMGHSQQQRMAWRPGPGRTGLARRLGLGQRVV
jgi:hypothetical protein